MLLLNSRLKHFAGKLNSKWSSSFMVWNIYMSGSIELKDHKMRRFMVKVQRLKHYHISGLGATKVETI